MQKFQFSIVRSLCFLLLVTLLPLGAAATSALPFSDALAEASQALDSYNIQALLDTGKKTLACTQDIRFTNRTGVFLNEILFHVYPNAFQSSDTSPVAQEGALAQPFSPGGVLFSSITANGEEVEAALQGEDQTLLSLPLEAAPGATLEITMEYLVILPDYAYRFGVSDGYFMLANVFPILSVFEDGDWRTDAYAPVGDPFFSECANYALTLTYPEGYQVAGTGVLQQQMAQDGMITATFEMPAVRDYALLLRKDLHLAQRAVGGVVLESYATTEKQAHAALNAAEAAFTYYQSILGDTYPYPKLTVSQGALGLFGGMEYPAYVVINAPFYQRGREEELFRVIAHEIAHQWWYGLVGNDQVFSPWLDEGLAEYFSILATGHTQGSQAMENYIVEKIEPAMRIDLPPGAVLSSSIWNFSTWSEYDRVIYKRSAGMFHGLHLALGDEAFFSAMRAFLHHHCFGIADREAFAAALEESTGANWRGYLDDYLDSRE